MNARNNQRGEGRCCRRWWVTLILMAVAFADFGVIRRPRFGFCPLGVGICHHSGGLVWE